MRTRVIGIGLCALLMACGTSDEQGGPLGSATGSTLGPKAGAGPGPGSGGDETGRLRILLHDAPTPKVDAVWVKFDKVTTHHVSRGWLTVSTKVQVVDLLKLRGGVYVQLGLARLPAGKYDEVRLHLVESMVFTGGQREALKVPSGTESGLKIKTSFEVPRCGFVTMTLDWDTGAHLKHNKGQGWILRPVIKVESVTTVTACSGCADGTDDDTFGPGMVRCDAARSLYSQSICARGWHICKYHEYLGRLNSRTPPTGYWLNAVCHSKAGSEPHEAYDNPSPDCFRFRGRCNREEWANCQTSGRTSAYYYAYQALGCTGGTQTTFCRTQRLNGAMCCVDPPRTVACVPPTTGTWVRKTIDAKTRWVDTGVNVRVGQTLAITANGAASGCTSGCRGGVVCYWRPDGCRASGLGSGCPAITEPCSARFVNSAFVVPRAYGYSLVGRIGSNPGFMVGATLCTRASYSGRLYLAVNDNTFGDNGGSYTVNVKVGP